MESMDMTAQNIEKIGALFPNCITETVDENGKMKKAVNFDLLRQMLSGDVVEGDEVYEFTWVGKKAAIVEANKPIRKTLRPCKEDSVNWDTTENLYIEGDNLEVLKLLQESYLGKVKMIYIDRRITLVMTSSIVMTLSRVRMNMKVTSVYMMMTETVCLKTRIVTVVFILTGAV